MSFSTKPKSISNVIMKCDRFVGIDWCCMYDNPRYHKVVNTKCKCNIS